MVKPTVLLLALFLVNAAYADSFHVQIGAFRSPDVSKIKLPAGVGELRSTSGPNGLTRFVVGPYNTRAAAAQALGKLQGAGFSGAFIRATRDQSETYELSSTAPTSTAQTFSGSQQSSSAESAQLELMRLTEEERRNVVILDGRLHKKVGDQFVPLGD